MSSFFITFLFLVINLMTYVAFIYVSNIKFTRFEAVCIFSVIAISYRVTFILFLDVTDIVNILFNIFLVILLSAVAYLKIRILALSILYGIFAVIVPMLGANLSGAILGFILVPMFGAANTEVVMSNAWVSVVYLFIAFAINYLISRKSGEFFHKQMDNLDDSLKKRFSSFILVGAVIILALFLINTFLHAILANYAILTLVNAVSMSIFFCFLVFSFFTFTNSVRKESEIHYKNEMLQSLQSYNVTVEDMATEMRRFRHDHMNMLLGFHEYIESNDIENIHSYFKQYMTAFSEATVVMESQIDELKNIKRPEIKSILSAKVLYAQQLGITVNIEVPDEIIITDVSSLLDLCRITGIFMDNAIEACRDLDSASLRFMSIKKGSEILFVFMNTCDLPPDIARLGDRGYTTKEGQRGLGLYTARRLIEKNSNLALSTLVQDGMFVQELSVLQ